MTNQEPLNFTTRIKSLEMISCSIDEKPKDLKVDEKRITFNIGFSMNVDEKEMCVTVGAPIGVFSDEKLNVRLGFIDVKGEFIIENFKEIRQKDNGIPLPIVATYVGVVISSARGMLRLISKGTSFEKAIIPIVNPTELLQSANVVQTKLGFVPTEK